MTDTMPDRDSLLGALRSTLNARIDSQGWRKRDGSLTKRGSQDAIEFLAGAATVIDALGLNGTHRIDMILWLACVRGPDDFLKG